MRPCGFKSRSGYNGEVAENGDLFYEFRVPNSACQLNEWNAPILLASNENNFIFQNLEIVKSIRLPIIDFYLD
ncbi:MAG: hypothetical protein PWR20_720 [Bacteroidales bacterium]|nr:hypothetical protein [Bacteroidales bacterium]MDN5329168.1 hypothetical protein [Bacteroidales bacterium]